MNVNANKLAVSQMARRLASGYYSFAVAHSVAVNPLSINSLGPDMGPGQDPIGKIKRKDGTSHTLNLRFYLDQLREDRDLSQLFVHFWAGGALLMLGDELGKHNYFHHAPILELVYHLRNGIAHGNKFNIDATGRKRLVQYPAHNHNADVKSPLATVFEITPTLRGTVLFNFMGGADLIDVLQSVEVYLSK